MLKLTVVDIPGTSKRRTGGGCLDVLTTVLGMYIGEMKNY
jgi:hypothetical protein